MSQLDFTNFSLETDRLVLVPLSIKYKYDVFLEFNTTISQYMFPKPADEISETEEFINSKIPGMKEGNDMQMVMTLKETGEFIGLAGLHEVKSKTPILGLWVKKSAHGNGYGREAITIMYHWAKGYTNPDYFKYSVDKDNIPSIKIPESLGGKVGETKTMKSLAGNTLNLLEYWIY
ncbi:MAG: GNAT family N-acetyltransferase [Ignavibacteria bacterium]|nr:GNAT family N-acetyltransferase [Ignavibacteria bacterium]